MKEDRDKDISGLIKTMTKFRLLHLNEKTHWKDQNSEYDCFIQFLDSAGPTQILHSSQVPLEMLWARQYGTWVKFSKASQ